MHITTVMPVTPRISASSCMPCCINLVLFLISICSFIGCDNSQVITISSKQIRLETTGPWKVQTDNDTTTKAFSELYSTKGNNSALSIMAFPLGVFNRHFYDEKQGATLKALKDFDPSHISYDSHGRSTGVDSIFRSRFCIVEDFGNQPTSMCWELRFINNTMYSILLVEKNHKHPTAKISFVKNISVLSPFFDAQKALADLAKDGFLEFSKGILIEELLKKEKTPELENMHLLSLTRMFHLSLLDGQLPNSQ